MANPKRIKAATNTELLGFNELLEAYVLKVAARYSNEVDMKTQNQFIKLVRRINSDSRKKEK